MQKSYCNNKQVSKILFFFHCSDPFTKLAKNVKSIFFSLCTDHAFQLQFRCLNNFFQSFFLQALKAPKKKERKEERKKARKENSLGDDWMTPDSPCSCVTFVSVFFSFSFQIRSTVNIMKVRSSFFIRPCAPRLVARGRAQHGAPELPASSHSVTGQLSPSSEVVNKHGHTVCAHQVVWISREGFVLPGFRITCK